jgi:hypothetical protein
MVKNHPSAVNGYSSDRKRNPLVNPKENLKGRDHSEDLSLDERIILKWILWKKGLSVWIGFIGSR